MTVCAKLCLCTYLYWIICVYIVVCNRISDFRKCVNDDCSVPISLATTLIRYTADDDRLLSFPSNAKAKIYSKEAGDKPNLWEAEEDNSNKCVIENYHGSAEHFRDVCLSPINGKRGYVPKDLLRENKMLVRQTDVKKIVSTGRDDNQKQNLTLENEGITNPKPADIVKTPELPGLNSKGLFSTIGGVSADSVPPSLPDINPQSSSQYEVLLGTTIYNEVDSSNPDATPETELKKKSPSLENEQPSTSNLVEKTPEVIPESDMKPNTDTKDTDQNDNVENTQPSEKNVPLQSTESSVLSDLVSSFNNFISSGSGDDEKEEEEDEEGDIVVDEIDDDDVEKSQETEHMIETDISETKLYNSINTEINSSTSSEEAVQKEHSQNELGETSEDMNINNKKLEQENIDVPSPGENNTIKVQKDLKENVNSSHTSENLEINQPSDQEVLNKDIHSNESASGDKETNQLLNQEDLHSHSGEVDQHTNIKPSDVNTTMENDINNTDTGNVLFPNFIGIKEHSKDTADLDKLSLNEQKELPKDFEGPIKEPLQNENINAIDQNSKLQQIEITPANNVETESTKALPSDLKTEYSASHHFLNKNIDQPVTSDTAATFLPKEEVVSKLPEVSEPERKSVYEDTTKSSNQESENKINNEKLDIKPVYEEPEITEEPAIAEQKYLKPPFFYGSSQNIEETPDIPGGNIETKLSGSSLSDNTLQTEQITELPISSLTDDNLNTVSTDTNGSDIKETPEDNDNTVPIPFQGNIDQDISNEVVFNTEEMEKRERGNEINIPVEESLLTSDVVLPVSDGENPDVKSFQETNNEAISDDNSEGIFTWFLPILNLFTSSDANDVLSHIDDHPKSESSQSTQTSYIKDESCLADGFGEEACENLKDVPVSTDVTWKESLPPVDISATLELLDKIPLEVTLWLIVTAVVVLIFSLGHYYIEAHRRDGPLVAVINKLEREVLILKKEGSILEDRLQTAQEQLEAWTTNSSENDALVVELKDELEETKAAKVELEEQVALLEREVETVTESGLEMHRLLSESLSSQDGSQVLLSTVESLREKLEHQEDEIVNLNQKLSHKNLELEELQEKLDKSMEVSSSLEEKIITIAREKEEEALELKDKHRQLVAQLEEIKETKVLEETRMSTEMVKQRLAIEELQKLLAEKDLELDELKEVVKQLRSTDTNEKMDALFDVVGVQARLKAAVSERDDFKEKFHEEEGARKLLEGHMKKISQEVADLKNSFETAEKEKIEALTKLQVLSNYFKEKESQLQKELGLQESMWLQKQSNDHTLYEQMRSLREENEKYKLQNESLKKEIVEQESSFKIQLANTEQKSHENWVASRQAERKLKEVQQEAAQLRNRLTMEKNSANFSLDESKHNISESNGDPSSSPPSMMFPPTRSPPFMMYPMPPPGDFMPPPPLMGSPYPSDSRPPPLGRISSPPLDHRFSPPPPLSYPAYDYSYGHHSPSPPPPLPPHSHNRLHKPQPRELSREQKGEHNIR